MKHLFLFQNNRNRSKYIMVKRYTDGHYYYCPFMYFDETEVLNVIGQRHRLFRRFRIHSTWTKEVLDEDYHLTPMTETIHTKLFRG